MFQQESKKLTPQEQMLADPSAMSSMMKGNLVQMVPQMLTMAWVNFFFSGFIVARVPFPLTQRFRGMLQRGVDLPSLDVTYVSSLSWYFLIVFGLSGVLQLLLGEATVNDTALMQQQMAMVRAACGWLAPRVRAATDSPPQGMDTKKAYVVERDALESLPHDWALPEVEKKAATRLKRLLAQRVA